METKQEGGFGTCRRDVSTGRDKPLPLLYRGNGCDERKRGVKGQGLVSPDTIHDLSDHNGHTSGRSRVRAEVHPCPRPHSPTLLSSLDASCTVKVQVTPLASDED